MATELTTNPSYGVTKKEDYEYDYVLLDSVQDSVQDIHRRGQGYNTLANETEYDDIIQPNSSYSPKVTSKMSRNEEGDGYLQIYSHNVQGPGYRATGNVVATDNVTLIPNPSYEVASGGVRLQDNPSYNKI